MFSVGSECPYYDTYKTAMFHTGATTVIQGPQGTTYTQLPAGQLIQLRQGMVDGSAAKPTLRQDTGYMVEKSYLDIASYLGAFGAYLMPQ